MSIPPIRRENRVALILAATTALVTITGAHAPLPALRPAKSEVLRMAGWGQSVWIVLHSGPQVALWSTSSPSGPWKHLGWPNGMDPVQLLREPANAWAVSMDHKVYTTANAGVTWKPVPLPRLLTTHPHWAQGLQVASMGPHTLALFAWGPEAAFHSAKLLWVRSNDGHRWMQVAHSIGGPIGATARWWPHHTAATLPTSGDPAAFNLLGSHHAYLISTTPGGTFLWRTANGGVTWNPVSVVGLPRRQADQGITIDHIQWKDDIGWIAAASVQGPFLIRLTRHTAHVVTLPLRLAPGLAAAPMSTTSGVVVGQTMGYWNVLRTMDSGNTWTLFKFNQRTRPYAGLVSQIYATPHRLWAVLTQQLYTGQLNRESPWHPVTLP